MILCEHQLQNLECLSLCAAIHILHELVEFSVQFLSPTFGVCEVDFFELIIRVIGCSSHSWEKFLEEQVSLDLIVILLFGEIFRRL